LEQRLALHAGLFWHLVDLINVNHFAHIYIFAIQDVSNNPMNAPIIDPNLSESIAATNNLADAMHNATRTLDQSTIILNTTVHMLRLVFQESTAGIERTSASVIAGLVNITRDTEKIATDLVDSSLPRLSITANDITVDSLNQLRDTTDVIVNQVFEQLSSRFINPILISFSITVVVIVLGIVACCYGRYAGNRKHSYGPI
jgi:hypothetical protein